MPILRMNGQRRIAAEIRQPWTGGEVGPAGSHRGKFLDRHAKTMKMYAVLQL